MLDEPITGESPSDSQVGITAPSRPYVRLNTQTGEVSPVLDDAPADRCAAPIGQQQWMWLAAAAGVLGGMGLVWRGLPKRSAPNRRAESGNKEGLPSREELETIAERVVVAHKLAPHQQIHVAKTKNQQQRRAPSLLGRQLDSALGMAVQAAVATAVARRAHSSENEQSASHLSRRQDTGATPTLARSASEGDHAPSLKSDAPRPRSWWGLLKATLNGWVQDGVPRLSAALAYYTVFSLAPLLLISLAVAGLVWQGARDEITKQLTSILGPQGASAIDGLLASAQQRPTESIWATVFGVVVLLFGASGVFGELQSSLNTIWGVQQKPGLGIWGVIRARFLSFAMVLGIGFLLLVSLVLSAILSAAGNTLAQFFGDSELLLHLTNGIGSFLVVTLLFAMMFKFLPDVQIAWRDVWLGAIVTAALFTIGKILIGLYIGQAAVASSFGAAGSIVIVMLWAYYSAMILFLGAEFTKAYAHMYGSQIRPSPAAMPIAQASCPDTKHRA